MKMRRWGERTKIATSCSHILVWIHFKLCEFIELLFQSCGLILDFGKKLDFALFKKTIQYFALFPKLIREMPLF